MSYQNCELDESLVNTLPVKAMINIQQACNLALACNMLIHIEIGLFPDNTFECISEVHICEPKNIELWEDTVYRYPRYYMGILPKRSI